MLKRINKEINKQYCRSTERKLNDGNLKKKYVNTNAHKLRVASIEKIIKRHNIKASVCQEIITDISDILIPHGIKACVRGKRFNDIVAEHIMSKVKRHRGFSLLLEKKHEGCTEIPDWILVHNESNNKIIGFNQLDFWRGGAQLNRASKYLLCDANAKERSNIRKVYVLARYTQIKSTNCKLFYCFKKGFASNTLFYLKGLDDYLNKWINTFQFVSGQKKLRSGRVC